jgi:hypothetical protein
MYNTDYPSRADLPTAVQLLRSTIIAGSSALALLVLVVLPSEYAVDLTGAGRLLGLLQMGEIKTQLAAEAAKDAQGAASKPNADYGEILQRLERIEANLVAPRPATPPPAQVSSEAERTTEITMAEASEAAATPIEPTNEAAAPVPQPDPTVSSRPEETASTALAADARADEMSITLAPGEGAEVKLVMRQGASANFIWNTSGGVVNFDVHGDAPGQKISYSKGRGVPRAEGMIEAAFDGNHGWFWRNRGQQDVTLTLRTSGQYAEIKRML